MKYDFLKLPKIGGDFAKFYDLIQDEKNIYAYSLSKGSKAHLSASLDKFVVYVAPDRISAREMQERISEYMDSERVGLLQEKEDILLYNKGNQSFSISKRIRTLYDLIKGNLDVLVIPSEVLVQYLPSRKELEKRILTFEVGCEYIISDIVEKLVAMGYTREEVVEEKGSFSMKGDIISIYPFDSEPVRLSFFDTELESIKEYDVETMISIRERKSVDILPCTDMIFDEKYLDNYTCEIDKMVSKSISTVRGRLQEIVSDINFEISEHNSSPALSWITPFIKDGLDDIFEYLPSDAVIIFDEPKVIDDKIKLYQEDNYNRVNQLVLNGEVLPIHKYSLINKSISYENAGTYTCVSFQNLATINPIFKGDSMIKFNISNIPSFYMDLRNLIDTMHARAVTKGTTILCARDEETGKSIADGLVQEDVPAIYVDSLTDLESGIFVMPIEITLGYQYNASNLMVVGCEELLRKKKKGGILPANKKRAFTIPKLGDYVVHEIHGIGLCQGIERKKFSDIERDYIIIQFAGTDKLYLPIDQLDKLSKYSGGDKAPRLSKFGGQEFERVKAKVKSSVREMAINLVDIYAERRKVKGYKYEKDSAWQKEFEDAFEFEETEDQLTAIREIKDDMEKGVVMDRLLCGDVGFGKTEVALRAVFKTIVEGKQAAILAPTTILAKQHYNTVLARFSEFHIKAVLLSRFQSKKEIAENLELIKTGKASIIVATHRLLSKDVEFNDLGLLVLDEEQRFGVEHKEKIKILNKNVNVLTLSATPIPRTLNMALTGIRDISVLENPPVSRLPIQTYVTEISDGLIRDAVERELARGGQVFILYNNVMGIEKFAEHVSSIVPFAKIIVGHGQMDARTLEDSIMRFYNKEANVLICTTIIENGIDLPDANTLIVCNADRLGLSALYQLRGRVGRSNKLAYAYFTVNENKVLTSDAIKRLNAITEFTEFGSGFKIAMRDLEIRGAGNLLGREQSGHIYKVGYDMYCKLLEEAVNEVSSERDKVKSIRNDGKGAEVNVEIDAYLPDSYISDSNEKMRIYNKIAGISSEKERDSLLSSLKDSYGEVPSQLVNLVNVGYVKNLANGIGASRVVINRKMTAIEFSDNECIRNEQVMLALSKMQDECTLVLSPKVMVSFKGDHEPNVSKLDKIIKFLKKSNGIL